VRKVAKAGGRDMERPLQWMIVVIYSFSMDFFRLQVPFLWQDMPEEDSHETESLLARSSISETQETLEIVIPEAGQL